MTLAHTTPTDLLQYRLTGAKGTKIAMHRALRSIPFNTATLATVIVLPLLFEALLLINMETIIMLWNGIMSFFSRQLNLPAQITSVGIKVPFGSVMMPALDIASSLPSPTAVWRNIFISLVLVVITMFLPSRMLPLTYLIRAGLAIQLSASVYFLCRPTTFPYELGGYIQGCMAISLYMLLLFPFVLGLIYYIFDFSIIKKIIITAIILVYFVLLLPFQYMMQAVIISHCGYLFLPVLYLMFGPLLDTLMFVSWYSWAMSRKP